MTKIVKNITIKEFLDWFYTEQEQAYFIWIGGRGFQVMEEERNIFPDLKLIWFSLRSPDGEEAALVMHEKTIIAVEQRP